MNCFMNLAPSLFIIQQIKEEKFCTLILPNSDPYIRKEIRATLSVGCGIK